MNVSTPIARISLAKEATDVIREKIQREEYRNYLLPERRLAIDLGVSRPTVRIALQALEKEGVIQLNGRKGRKIIHNRSSAIKCSRPIIVRLLQNNTPSSFLNEHLQMLEFFALNLRGPDAEFHIETAPACFASGSVFALEKLVSTRPTDVWILYLATEEIQNWFQKKNLRCVVLGSCFEGIEYPSIDEDFTATCRHAAGIFLSRGHTRLALLTPDKLHPGDLASKIGFQQGFAHRVEDNDFSYEEVVYDENPGGICKAADKLLKQPNPTTGWLILNPQTYFTISSYLSRKGILIGRDISLICRSSDPYLQLLVPSVAHYTRKVSKMCRRLLVIVMQVSGGHAPAKSRWLFDSEFCLGGSLGILKAGCVKD